MSDRKSMVSTSPLALLDHAIATIELSEQQKEKIVSSYTAVATALKKSKTVNTHFKDLDIGPQGSIRAGTTIRPYHQHEFDLDMLCVVVPCKTDITPSDLLDLIWTAIGEFEMYKSVRERKQRCIRLNVSEDFHLDLTPALLDTTIPFLFVPDKSGCWVSTNPIGFCDHWFLPITHKYPPQPFAFSAANGRTLLNTAKSAKVTVEPLPENGTFDKRPLQRIVQLAKYDRDTHFRADSPLRPSSIILTTILGHSYESAIDGSFLPMNEFVLRVLRDAVKYIQIQDNLSSPKYIVLNPKNPGENFSDRWTDQSYEAFIKWHSGLVARLDALIHTETKGLDAKLNLLEEQFPGTQKTAASFLASNLRNLHDTGSLAVKTSLGAAAPLISVKPTIFYGAHA